MKQKQTTRRLLAGIVLAFAMVSTIAVAGDWPWYRPIGHDKNDTFNLDGSPVTNAGAIAFSDGTLWTAAKAAAVSAGGTAGAINGSAITNLNAANIRAGTTASAINGASITNLGAANIAASGTLPALNGSALTALSAANVTAGGSITAINGAAITNLNPANIADPTGGTWWSGAITNAGVGGTSSNITWYYRGGVTNVTYLP